MNGTHSVVMGDRGRLVVPQELRQRWHLDAGTSVILVETPSGIVLATRDQVKRVVRDQLRGASLVDELIEERRAEAAAVNVVR
jgi:bifunctional DNA-binding transcriptional regulator/antitoxin component of YhaV-PrlF toxin-antitoxin module